MQEDADALGRGILYANRSSVLLMLILAAGSCSNRMCSGCISTVCRGEVRGSLEEDEAEEAGESIYTCDAGYRMVGTFRSDNWRGTDIGVVCGKCIAI
jgi:hypothetical protein